MCEFNRISSYKEIAQTFSVDIYVYIQPVDTELIIRYAAKYLISDITHSQTDRSIKP